MLRALLLGAAAGITLPCLAAGQTGFHFSIDWHSPEVGLPDAFGTPITEGDLLTPDDPGGLPYADPTRARIGLDHAAGSGLQLPPGCAGHLAGTPCIVEVDAVSFGNDRLLLPGMPVPPGTIAFSVDDFALGLPGAPAPSVRSEASSGDAAGDVFLNIDPIPVAPAPLAPRRNVCVIDGNGVPAASGHTAPGLAIKGTAPAGPGVPDTASNVDAFDLTLTSIAGASPRRFYSLDAAFADALEGVLHSGSAAAAGFSGGAVLATTPAGTPAVFASAPQLGLDGAGFGTDDLDALILQVNGNPGYQPSLAPYDWAGGATDMLIFSVRRGSAVIGLPDSLSGIPIEPGDLLIPPVAGGVSPFPAILIPAEALGLRTLRGGAGPMPPDDLDGADAIGLPVYDCDGDGREDAVAIAMGLAPDADLNGIPDGCERTEVGDIVCKCDAAAAPCGNDDPGSGCRNVTTFGARLRGYGSTSVALDDLEIEVSRMPSATFFVVFYGSTVGAPVALRNGARCVGGVLNRLPVQPTGSGTAVIGPGLSAFTVASYGPALHLTAGTTWGFQAFYRDNFGPCGLGANLSNALEVTFTP